MVATCVSYSTFIANGGYLCFLLYFGATLGGSKQSKIKMDYFNRKHITPHRIHLRYKDPETDMLDWRLRFIFFVKWHPYPQTAFNHEKKFFKGHFLCNDKAITNMTLFLNCVHLDWKE